MKVAIYARYSTDLQDRTSIDGQIANCEALADREGLEVVARYQDEGRSGNDDQRDGYQNMLARLKRGEFVGIVCDETSRITRNQAELHRLTAELRFRDQFLITCDGIDTRSESSDLVLSVKAAIDQMEGRKIGYRTYRSLRERHKAGHSAGGKIYGYSSVATDDGYRRRVVAPEQVEVVQEIFERYAAGEGAKVIARALNERGVPCPGSYWNLKKRRARGWGHTTLLGSETKASGILRNAIYTGRAQWNKRKGKKVPGTAQRIQTRRPEDEWVTHKDESLRLISDELFERVQQRLKASRRRSHPKNKRPRGRPARHLLSGLMKCACCGGSYIICNGRSYVCSSHTNGRDALCDQSRYLKRELVESRLLAGVKKQLLAPKVIREIGKLAQKEIKALKRDQKLKSQEATELREEIKDLEHQIENVTAAIAKLGCSDGLTERLVKLERQKARADKRLPAIKTVDDLPDILPRVAEKWRELVSDLQRLDQHTVDSDTLSQARSGLKELLGEVQIRETEDGVEALVGFQPSEYKLSFLASASSAPHISRQPSKSGPRRVAPVNL